MFTNSLIATSRPWVSKVIHGIAIMLLTGCLVLNLILLLLPTSSLHLSVFSIEPTGKQLVAKTPTPTNNETITLSPNISMGAYEGLNKEPENRTAIVEAPKFWMGIDGPSIWVGAMSICSKRSGKGEISCTSASRASEHSTALPFTLSDSLVVMPTSPPVPILLVVGALCLAVALAVYLVNLITQCQAYTTFRERSPFNLLRRQPKFSTRNHRHTMMSTDSTITLVNPSSDVSTPRPKYPVSLIVAFALTCGSFGLSLAATVIEMLNVQRAKDHWSGEQAVEIGMEWQHGALTFLMPALPAALLLSILICLVPLVGHLNRGEGVLGQKIVSAPAPTADAEDVKSVSPLTKVPPGWTRINMERPRSGFRAVGDAEKSTTVRASVIGTAV